MNNVQSQANERLLKPHQKNPLDHNRNTHCSLQAKLSLGETKNIYGHDAEINKTSTDILGQCPAFVESSLRHLGEYLIPENKLKRFELGNILKILSVIGLLEIP